MTKKSAQKQIQEISDAYTRGILEGKALGIAFEKKRLSEDFGRRQQLARVSVVEAATKLANALGQSIEALTNAMRSEANQL